MLPRVLEPEVMDTAQEAIDYDAMDHSAVNRLFVTDFLFAAIQAGLPVAEEPVAAGKPVEVLDLGTGTAQIPIELCRRTTNVRVVGIDLAAEMLQMAKLNVEMASLRERIMLDRVDGKRLPYQDGRFDAVMSNSIVHHIPEPASVLAEAARVARPGGLIFIRDLLRPDSDADVVRLVGVYAAGCNEHQRGLFEASLRAALSLDEIRALIAALGFPADSVRATSDRHWTWMANATLA
jgi:ubiquinone/menaquinone biosynthesis C-methylase UbiE